MLMKKSYLMIAGLVSFLAACTPSQKPALTADEQMKLVQSLDSMYSHHIEKQQSDSLSNTFLSDAILLSPSEAETKGINAIKEWYQNSFDYGLKTVTFKSTSVAGDNNHIIEIGQSTVGLMLGDADTLTFENYKYIHVWTKQENGVYKLSRDMWNQDQAKQ